MIEDRCSNAGVFIDFFVGFGIMNILQNKQSGEHYECFSASNQSPLYVGGITAMTIQDSISSLSENQDVKVCSQCGKPLNKNQKAFCSRECFYDSIRRSNETCKFCGKEFKPKKTDNTTYCSRDCYYAHKTEKRIEKESYDAIAATGNRECVICGKIFTGKTNVIYCSDECRRENARRRSYVIDSSKKEIKPVVCKECGVGFVPEYGDKRKLFCSRACSRRYTGRTTNNNRNRAKKYSVAYESVDPIKVFKRDGWRCQICGKVTPRRNRGTFLSNAPELDHRIPISKGGPHLYSNVQCACRQCNGKKSNNNNAGQLPLFGVGSAERLNENRA